MQDTKIQWCSASWNPTRGCRRIGVGCLRCYAEKTAARFNGPGLAYEGLTTNGRWNGTGRWLPEKFLEPLSWRKPERIFVNSMSDLFFEEFDAETVIAPIFATMSRAHWHTFIVLTKRYERAAMLLSDPAFVRAVDDARGGAAGDFTWPLPNVIVGGSLSNQDEVDRYGPHILKMNAAVRMVSLEPLIGPVDLRGMLGNLEPRLHWAVVGGESGGGARPCNVEWIRSVVRQCRAKLTAAFVKQLGAHVIDRNDAGFEGDLEVYAEGFGAGQWTRPAAWPHTHAAENRIEHLDSMNWQGAPVRIHLRDRKGGEMQEWPLDLRIRQFPEVPHA